MDWYHVTRLYLPAWFLSYVLVLLASWVMNQRVRRQLHVDYSAKLALSQKQEAGWRLHAAQERDAAQASAESERRARAETKHAFQRVDEVQRQAREEIECTRSAHPRLHRMIYNIGIIGEVGTGKTATIMSLIDPYYAHPRNQSSSSRDEKHDHLVCVDHDLDSHTRIEHIFRFHEWGGEYLIEAQVDMVRARANAPQPRDGVTEHPGLLALIFTVDVAHHDAQQQEEKKLPRQIFDLERIRVQVERTFCPAAVDFLLNNEVLANLQTVALFVNKCDTMEGTATQISRQAQHHYRDLVGHLRGHRADTEVIVGSADTGMGLPQLYSLLVRKVLPKEAWPHAMRPGFGAYDARAPEPPQGGVEEVTTAEAERVSGFSEQDPALCGNGSGTVFKPALMPARGVDTARDTLLKRPAGSAAAEDED